MNRRLLLAAAIVLAVAGLLIAGICMTRSASAASPAAPAEPDSPFQPATAAEKAAPAPPAPATTDDAKEPTREELFKTVAAAVKTEGTTKDDVLTITLPKAEEAKPKRVEVTVE